MELFDAEILAKQLISEYVPLYTFKWNNLKRSFGMCSYRERTIYLSRPLTELCEPETVRNTIMHEIAHALTPGQGHGRVWKIQMIKFGLNPDRLCNAEIDRSGIANWEAKCSTCGKLTHMIRKPRLERSCKPCSGTKFNKKYLLTYYKI